MKPLHPVSSPGVCPAPEDLSAFYLGKLPPDSLQGLADHLDGCPRCHSSLQALEGRGDALLAGLRQGLPAEPYSGERECLQVLQHMQARGPDVGLLPRPDPPARGRLGQYELLALLGRGGMGTVYQALHPRLKRVVALKVLSGRHADNAVARFQREMEAVGKLDHPHIVRASDAGEADGSHFLVMDFVEGLDLARLVKVCGPLPVADACELIRQAALGLHHAHQHGLVHRDVKPSNLMLDGRGQVKVLDLGLALVQQDHLAPEWLTAHGQMVGTFDYMAPEQGTDTHAVGIPADVYSLGCTLYHLLAGHPPFSGPAHQTVQSKLWAHAHTAPPPIEGRASRLPPGLQAVLKRLLAKDPAARFPSAAELAAALAPFTEGHDLPGLLARAPRAEAVPVPQAPVAADTDAPLASALVGTSPDQEPLHGPAGQGAEAPAPGAGRNARRTRVLLGLLVLFGGILAAFQVLQRPTRPGPEDRPSRTGKDSGSTRDSFSLAQSPLAALAAPQGQTAGGEGANKTPRVYPVALFAFEERGSSARELGAKVADLLAARLGDRPDLLLVDRQELHKTLAEAELSLSGAVRPAEAVRVGQLTGAKLLVCGSVTPVDKRLFLVAKVIGTETGRVFVASVEGRASDELAPLTDQLAGKVARLIEGRGKELVAGPAKRADRLKDLARTLRGKKLPRVLVRLGERHVGADPADPAAQTELLHWLTGCGFEVIDATEGTAGQADVLLTGEALSEAAGRHGGLVSARGRVEVKAVARRGGRVLAAERQVAVAVDLSEQLAGKAALQRAAAELAQRLLPRLVREEEEKER